MDNMETSRIEYAFGNSSLGLVLAARTARGLCAVLLGEDRGSLLADLRRRFPGPTIVEEPAAFADALATIRRRIDDPRSTADLELDPRGTDFQRLVWRGLQEVPAGSTVSYARLAASIGQPRSVRAVASACAANPLAILVPCHRAVRSNGELSGYRWGTERKRQLLAKESTLRASS
jgi:AraC family transcriptional regulator of adaptative response/methylated-DNA-[protein]-cysteine methyltransferase